MGTTYCVGLSVRGALGWGRRDLKRLGKHLIVDGVPTPLDVEATRSMLMDALAAGREMLPLGECDNWDWKKGCQGHTKPRETAT